MGFLMIFRIQIEISVYTKIRGFKLKKAIS